ncbi:hypothetical protein BDV93DRAFT_481954 [Ceratobasidium sp. AG-I]|nr:hypothetical protein BDV93DRAFT_481954 [Ceratobasidium sp. AG-I]
MSSDSTVDVLIFGAGPAGVMSALNLSQAGLTVRIVDRKKERLLKGQGDVLQIRGIEILDSLNLLGPIISKADRVYHYATYHADSDNNISRMERRNVHAGINGRFLHTLMYPQSEIELVFRNAMGSGEKVMRSLTVGPESGFESVKPRKVVVEQGTRPTQLSVSSGGTGLDDYPVTVVLEHPDGKAETVRAKYVVGCDGAHSWTRVQLGIDMVGVTSNDVWGVVDTWVDTDFPDIRNITMAVNNGRMCALIPRENDMVRFTVRVEESDVSLDPVTGRVDRTKIDANRVKQLVREKFQPYRIDFTGELDWSGAYVIGQRLASAYEGGQGRVFIVGDACHTHSPHAGQGMNAALSDAHNLSWKLVHVLKGWASPEVLHTYESERRGFAKELIQLHERLGHQEVGESQGKHAEEMQKSGGFVSGTTVQYPPSSIVDTRHQSLAPGILIGQRLPHQVILRVADCRPYSTHDLLKSDFRYKLLLFTGDVKHATQRELIEKLSDDMSQWLAGANRPSVPNAMIQIYTVMHGKKESSEYTDIPQKLRSHWDTVFLDDVALDEANGGGSAYQAFGIGAEGCVVIVRPDGHVAAIAPLGEAELLKEYFERMKNSS